MNRKPDPLLEKYGIPTDPVIEAFKKDVDITLLRENLKLSPTQRIAQLQAMANFVEAAHRARKLAHD